MVVDRRSVRYNMLKRWCTIKEIEVSLPCEILTSKDTLQGQKTVTRLLKGSLHSFRLTDFAITEQLKVQRVRVLNQRKIPKFG